MIRIVLAFISVIGTAARPVAAEEEPPRISIVFDAGFISEYAGETDIWSPGTAAGVSCLYAVHDAVMVGGRIGLNHWGYNDSKVIGALVSEGSELLSRQSTGQLQIIEIGPVIRYTRDRILGDRVGLYVQFSGDLAYVKTFALSEVMFSSGGYRPTVRKFEINESHYRAGFVISGGFARLLSKSSWIELFPSYRGIIDEVGLSDFAGISLAYRAGI